MQRTLVVDVVGLSPRHIGAHTPHLKRLAERGGMRPLVPTTPAVTTSVQSSFVTGAPPREHGIVANGWYFRDLAEIWFWRQSNRLVQGEKIWDAARKRDASFSCAKLFWWYNMYADVDLAVTPRPMYPADGRKIPDVHSHPGSIRHELTEKLGPFPLFRFWGPASDIVASRWITDCALHLDATRPSTLTLVYLPHLDYALQKVGPGDPSIASELERVDQLVGELVERAEKTGQRVIVLSEYGIVPVSGPVHPNRALREAGLIEVREELGRELLDAGASRAFAVSDHQIAHVYVRDPARVAEVKAILEGLDGVGAVLDEDGKRAHGLDHERSGELVLLAEKDRWFTYYYWLDDERAPDFARTVDIHRKPGFDPVELFIDPAIKIPPLALGWRLAKKTLGFRTLMDVIPLDASLVKGSHGLLTERPEDGPLLIASEPDLLPEGPVPATAVKPLILTNLFD